MTKESKIEQMKKFVKNLKVYNQDYYNENRNNEAWYGGTVLSYEYKNYKLLLRAIGDNEGIVVIKNNHDFSLVKYIPVKDERNQGELGYLLRTNGITSDNQIKIIDGYLNKANILNDFLKASPNVKAIIYLDYGNWWQVDVEKDGELIFTDGDDCTAKSLLYDSKEELEEFLDYILNI